MSDHLLQLTATVLAEVKKLAAEVNEIRSMMADNLTKQAMQAGLEETKAEIAMVDALGLDPISYLKNKSKKHRRATATPKKRPAQLRV